MRNKVLRTVFSYILICALLSFLFIIKSCYFCSELQQGLMFGNNTKREHHVCPWNAKNEFYRRTQYKLNKTEDWKKVLIWTPYFNNNGIWDKVFGRHCLKECEETRCVFTMDHQQLNEADAILFDGNSLKTKDTCASRNFSFPSTRKESQVYIFFSTEPPTRFGNIDFDSYENFFNWTMTYRRDSDVVVPFGVVLKKRVKTNNTYTYISQSDLEKKKFGIWLHSHCVNYPRVQFAERLQRYVNITVYGLCVNKICGTRALMRSTTTVGADSCEKTFDDYVFFMALENSLCKDYVTEKLFRSLKLGIIPVTYGAVNYTEIAPPHSFIDAKDFRNESELASYLKQVASNVTLYNEYFKWKEEYDIDVGTPYKPLICDLCKQLHSSEARIPKSYASMKDWFIKKSECSQKLNRRT